MIIMSSSLLLVKPIDDVVEQKGDHPSAAAGKQQQQQQQQQRRGLACSSSLASLSSSLRSTNNAVAAVSTSSSSLLCHTSFSSSSSFPHTTARRKTKRDASTIALDERVCQHCYERGAMVEDWKNGDRICTSCGVVDEGHLIDDTPEWREYENENNETNTSVIRSGLVPTDETKYWGGLQPTKLSKFVFNGPSSQSSGAARSSSSSDLRKRLWMASNRVNRRIEQLQKQQLQDAKVSLLISKQQRKRKRKIDPDETTDDDSSMMIPEARPELEHMLLQEEEDANKIQMALYADKWSLHRALKLHGNAEIDAADDDDGTNADDDNDNTAAFRKRLDPTLQKASYDLYTAYCMLNAAALKLKLSPSITHEAVLVLCRYAQLRDGITVRGVASNNKLIIVPSSNNNSSTTTNSVGNTVVRARVNRMTYSNNVRGMNKQLLLQQQAREQQRRRWSVGSTSNNNSANDDRNNNNNNNNNNNLQNGNNNNEAWDEKEHTAFRRDYNKWKQMGALGSALLFFAARNMKSPRMIAEVCDCMEPPSQPCNNNNESIIPPTEGFIKLKHCSRAMNELKECFPDFARSSSAMDGGAAVGITSAMPQQVTQNNTCTIHSHDNNNNRISEDAESITNFIEHALRKLALPPVAEASIQCLVLYWRYHRHDLPNSGKDDCNLGNTKLPTICAAVTYFICLTGSIMQGLAAQAAAAAAVEKQKRQISPSSTWSQSTFMQSKMPAEGAKVTPDYSASSATASKTTNESFDVFALDSSTVNAEQRAYEMRRMWDAWSSQMSWSRSISDIEKSCGVSQKVLRFFYKKQLFPCRQQLLSVLRDSVSVISNNSHKSDDCSKDDIAKQHYPERNVLGQTPLASVLLPHITVAAPLMKADPKQ